MEKFWILILVAFFVINSRDKAEAVQMNELEELPLQTFDELFVDEWLDKNKAEDFKMLAPTNFGQNVHCQINRQNTPLGQIEPNSADQLGQIEPNSTDQLEQIQPNSTDQLGQIQPNSPDQLGEIVPNSTDQNPPLTESDHFENAKDEEMTSNEKRKIIDKFHKMKDEFKQKGKFPWKERTKIEEIIAKHLKVNRSKIYKWKNEFGLSQKKTKNERINLIEKFDQMKAELMRNGFKNSYKNELDKTVAKELGLSFRTIYNWKSELGQTEPNQKYAQSEQKELMKGYYEIKDKNPKIRDEDIAKMFKIGRATLVRWKRQFKREQLDQNSVDRYSVEENAAANVQEIEKSNLAGSI